MFVDHDLLDAVLRGVILCIPALAWVVFLIRINGLRTLSKMSNFDFVITLAVGSLLAAACQAQDVPSFAQPLAATTALVVMQFGLAKLSRASEVVDEVLHTDPLLLMQEGEFLLANLNKVGIAQSDVVAKLREANALKLELVRAVVLEATGDVSVLHGEELDDRLLAGVRGL